LKDVSYGFAVADDVVEVKFHTVLPGEGVS